MHNIIFVSPSCHQTLRPSFCVTIKTIVNPDHQNSQGKPSYFYNHRVTVSLNVTPAFYLRNPPDHNRMKIIYCVPLHALYHPRCYRRRVCNTWPWAKHYVTTGISSQLRAVFKTDQRSWKGDKKQLQKQKKKRKNN